MVWTLMKKASFTLILLLLSGSALSVSGLHSSTKSDEFSNYEKNEKFAMRLLQQSRVKAGLPIISRNRSGYLNSALSSTNLSLPSPKKGYRNRIRQRERFVPVIGAMGIAAIVASGILLLISGNEDGVFATIAELFDVQEFLSSIADLPNGDGIIATVQDALDNAQEILNDIIELLNLDDAISSISDLLNGNDLFSSISDFTNSVILSITNQLNIESIINDIESLTGGGDLLTAISTVLDDNLDIDFETLTAIFESLADS